MNNIKTNTWSHIFEYCKGKNVKIWDRAVQE